MDSDDPARSFLCLSGVSLGAWLCLLWAESPGRAEEICLGQGGEGILGRGPASTEVKRQESTWWS